MLFVIGVCELFCIFARYIYIYVDVELITNIIIEYLKRNKRLVVPKLGAFIVKQPGNKIIFSELMRGEDETLRSLLVAYGMSELEASGMIDRLVFEIRYAVGRGESYAIRDLGIFAAGDNNNIVFKQQREPMKIGGNIKPPIESLNEAKRKLQRATTDVEDKPKERLQSPKPKARGGYVESRDEGVNMTKPDSYLRGLRYENKKEKGNDDDYRRMSHRGAMSARHVKMMLGVLALCAIILVVWYFGFRGDDKPQTPHADVAISGDNAAPRDTLSTSQDSLMMADTAIMIEDIVN